MFFKNYCPVSNSHWQNIENVDVNCKLTLIKYLSQKYDITRIDKFLMIFRLYWRSEASYICIFNNLMSLTPYIEHLTLVKSLSHIYIIYGRMIDFMKEWMCGGQNQHNSNSLNPTPKHNMTQRREVTITVNPTFSDFFSSVVHSEAVCNAGASTSSVMDDVCTATISALSCIFAEKILSYINIW